MRRRRPREGDIIGTAFCPVCEETMPVHLVDDGFSYEYGSDRGTHHDWGAECSECGETISLKNVDEAEDTRDYGDDL